VKLPVGTHTFYNNFENCPHKAYHIYIARTIPFEMTPEMKWGNEVHKALEQRITMGTALPDTMKAAEPIAGTFHSFSKVIPVICEYQLAMTQAGDPCDYGDYDKCFFRGKLDCVVMSTNRTDGWLVDWKTGNVREDPFELECQALLLKVNQPTLTSIAGEYFWLKTGTKGLRYDLTRTNHGNTYARLVKLRSEAEGYLQAGDFPKRKNPLCGWCPVTSCEHNTSHKRK
jgi:hypothetical protein